MLYTYLPRSNQNEIMKQQQKQIFVLIVINHGQLALEMYNPVNLSMITYNGDIRTCNYTIQVHLII